MTDTTSPIPPITQPVVDRYRKWDAVWYRFLKPLFDTVRSTERAVTQVSSDLTTVNETIDAVQSSYGVTVNVNGRVTAAIKLDGSPAQSSFAVLADKFIIVHPTNDATELQAFVVGLVNGTSTVGINGNLIVDGTILARHLEVDTLSAISADIGTVTAGLIESTNGKVQLDLDNGTLTITS